MCTIIIQKAIVCSEALSTAHIIMRMRTRGTRDRDGTRAHVYQRGCHDNAMYGLLLLSRNVFEI